MLEQADGSRMASAGWNALQSRAPMAAAAASQNKSGAAPAEPGLWDPAFELTVHVEIPQMGGFAHRPYLAVWVEDKDRAAVRTVALLFSKPRWLNELRAWYRDEHSQAMAAGNAMPRSVTGATRPPGKYSFNWDGKDNHGKPVKAGPYTVFVEAAREHGGYSLVHHEMDFNGEPAQAQLPPGGELGAVTLDYRKVAH
jgi:hypothetical protein